MRIKSAHIRIYALKTADCAYASALIAYAKSEEKLSSSFALVMNLLHIKRNNSNVFLLVLIHKFEVAHLTFLVDCDHLDNLCVDHGLDLFPIMNRLMLW